MREQEREREKEKKDSTGRYICRLEKVSYSEKERSIFLFYQKLERSLEV